MNIEVEIKVKIENLNEIREKISKMGKLVRAIKQVDEYYVPCHRDFFAHKPRPDEYLRIRTNPDKVVFEYDKSINKKADGEQDYSEEYEAEIRDVEEFKKILGFLDFKKVVTVEKNREYWMCGKIEMALDDVVGLGSFVEAEAKGDFENEAEAKKACVEFLKNLGFKDIEKNYVKQGYSDLMFEKKG